ncbi:MAG: polysaccharide pyruvyl transferase family protein [Lachnospiraceae bacterium]
MKKIGILTFHRSRNYGAVLQAYGLVKTLENLGFESEVIDYCCLPIENTLKLWNPSKNILRSIKQFVFRLQKKGAFEGFIKRWIPLSNIKNITKYDYIIAGSDQIWNALLTGNDAVYFLDIGNIEVIKIAYAASCGDTVILDENNINKIREFNAVSVREKGLKKFLDEKGIVSTLCCDPTLLLESTDFLSMAGKRLYKEKYLFLFMMWEDKGLVELANDYAKKNGYIVISNKNCVKFFLYCKPEDFISWIYYAECILTNSFHATVFSLKFQKTFLSDINRPDGEKNTRIVELLTETKCNKCMIDSSKENVKLIYQTVDYDYVDFVLKEMQEKSMHWLKSNLEFYSD